MKPLYTQEEFKLAKYNDKLPCQCYHCENTFYITKHGIQKANNPNCRSTGHFCSSTCSRSARKTKENVKCAYCNIIFEKHKKEIKKSLKHFCSHTCRATYYNKNKTHGTKRSKLEIYLEEQLSILYPNIEIHFNRKDTIGSELDIYIPSLNIAFELNGIFHYEPIYGNNKLEQTQSNDISKSKACFEAKIDLCVIDTSQQKYFKPSTSQKYLDIITKIINERLPTS